MSQSEGTATGPDTAAAVLSEASSAFLANTSKPEASGLPVHGFDSIESALEALRKGEMVVVLDDEKRENEGDLIMAADKVLSFLITLKL